MGPLDRIIRGVLGSTLLVRGLSNGLGSRWGRFETLLGGAFIVYSATGMDPLLKVFGASTRMGAENNVLNLVRQALPGQGTNPKTLGQAVPQKTPGHRTSAELPLADALAIR
jgi:hypothetical protein